MFNKDALERDLPGRLSKLVELPVVKHNDLSIYYCRRCIGKLISVEKISTEMKSLARDTYTKAGFKHRS